MFNLINLCMVNRYHLHCNLNQQRSPIPRSAITSRRHAAVDVSAAGCWYKSLLEVARKPAEINNVVGQISCYQPITIITIMRLHTDRKIRGLLSGLPHEKRVRPPPSVDERVVPQPDLAKDVTSPKFFCCNDIARDVIIIKKNRE
ncbi:hypothetical protein EVAR_85829_1 [Eumeta japonica]|uniref:Uncharacterized protein n=1 Tax=Eumeta variegata TaxID=151549 RepID=A0A4C1UQY3_EUMVA|nr:hypothetical protein EVAR_85829_1 [Eumeta japonica]